MDHLMTATATIICCFISTISGGRFDPSKVKPLPKPPSRFMNSSQYITYYGYKSEVYNVQTEDGYILPLTHIVKNSGPPVLLVTGLGGGGEVWVLHGPGHDIGFILADMGYDVWLGHQRGNAETSHIRLSTFQPEFWNFSFDEIGYYDLPAMIDLILSKSDHKKLYYGSESMGGNFFTTLCSERPEYESLFAGSFHLVPSIYLPSINDYPPMLKTYMSALYRFTDSYIKVIGHSSIFQRTPIIQNAIKNVFEDPKTKELCYGIFNLVFGFEEFNMAPGWYAYTVSVIPSGTSVRAGLHLMQIMMAGGGNRKFDWGPKENFKRYGTYEPPSYNLSKITSPTALYYSKADKIVLYSAYKKAIRLIGNMKHPKEINNPTYGHMEFVIAKDLYKTVYVDIVDFFDSISELGNSISLSKIKNS